MTTKSAGRGSSLPRPRIGKRDLERVTLALGRLARLRRQQTDAALPFSHISLLFSITDSPNQPPTVSELAATERVAVPTLVRALNQLQALGLVERSSESGDRRVRSVRITQAGLDEQRAQLRSSELWVAERISRLPAEDVALILAALPAMERLSELSG